SSDVCSSDLGNPPRVNCSGKKSLLWVVDGSDQYGNFHFAKSLCCRKALWCRRHFNNHAIRRFEDLLPLGDYLVARVSDRLCKHLFCACVEKALNNILAMLRGKTTSMQNRGDCRNSGKNFQPQKFCDCLNIGTIYIEFHLFSHGSSPRNRANSR